MAAATNTVTDFRNAAAIPAAHPVVGEQDSERNVGPERLDERRDIGRRFPVALQRRQALIQSRQGQQSPDNFVGVRYH